MSSLPAKEPHVTTKRDEGSAIELVIEARERDLGGLTVRRALPAMQRRLVGPFIFFDHMGPVTMPVGAGMDVRPHPHIALATVTYLFEGEIVHKDSLGSDQPIRPGDVNWMVAGRGIVHSERSSAEERARGVRAHGIQAWVALPLALEDGPPSFVHTAAAKIPRVKNGGVELAVIAGTAYGVTSPVAVSSPTLYVEARLASGTELELPDDEERAAYVVSGVVECEGQRFGESTMLVFAPGPRARVVLRAAENVHVMIIGGEKLDGERHIYWNFVASSKERIEEAKSDWRAQNLARFPRVPGDDVEFIPLPGD